MKETGVKINFKDLVWFITNLGKLYNEDPDQLQEPFDYENFDLID